MQNLTTIILAGAFVLFLIILGATLLNERRRREAMQRIASEIGMDYLADDQGMLNKDITRFHLFRRGRARRVRNVMTGLVADLQAYLFDYKYTVGGGRNARTFRHTVAAFRVPQRMLAGFELRPESLFHKIGSALGFQDIDFPSHPAFSSRYLLRGEDEGAIRNLFSDDVLRFFEQCPPVCVEAAADWIVVHWPGRRVAPDDIAGFLEEAFNICTTLA
jgi:hypothetical protein